MNKEQVAFLEAVERAEAIYGGCYVPDGSVEESVATDLGFALYTDIHRYGEGSGEWDDGYRLNALGRMLLALSNRVSVLEAAAAEDGDS